MSKYISTDEISSEELAGLTKKSAANFRAADVTPLVKVGDSWVLELFHGPTFAFKDVALQFLGNLFEFFLERRRARGEEARLTILGATSGDTGSAAIYGLRGKKYVECFIMFPEGRVSDIQERQMTTVLDENIHNVAVWGTFDDCQALVKAAFNDKAFREEVSLGAVNSINWARVLAQMTYFFWAYFRVTDAEGLGAAPVNFSVPTGNFGDILAGYYAKRMGLDIGKLVVATNENDILHRFFTTGKYWREGVQATVAPSMDICVSSNFERFLFHLAGDNAATLKSWMDGFEKNGKLTVEGELLKTAQKEFLSARVALDENLATIKTSWEKDNYLLCPHTSIGVAAPAKHSLAPASTVALATAHPGKFYTAVKKAVPEPPPLPPQLACLWDMPNRKLLCKNDLKEVMKLMREQLAGGSESSGAASGTRKKRARGGFGDSSSSGNTLMLAACVGAAAAVAVLAIRWSRK